MSRAQLPRRDLVWVAGGSSDPAEAGRIRRAGRSGYSPPAGFSAGGAGGSVAVGAVVQVSVVPPRSSVTSFPLFQKVAVESAYRAPDADVT